MDNNLKKLAAEIFAANPSENTVHIFRDTTAFFLIDKAQAYQSNIKAEAFETFYREGFTPTENTEFLETIAEKQELEEKVENLQETNAALETDKQELTEKVESLQEENKTLEAENKKLKAEAAKAAKTPAK